MSPDPRSVPKRIQRKRTKGWRMPEGAVYVGRPTQWGNPFKAGDTDPVHGCPMLRGEAVAAFIEWLNEEEDGWVVADQESLAPLRGKDLVCWCPLNQPCHADVLLEIANV